ncbi:MAG: hypothetical protein JOZ27_05645 [Caulobacteraceae bacterium]|nr:hypothetical protein [Caulobacteraceae bacterium]
MATLDQMRDSSWWAASVREAYRFPVLIGWRRALVLVPAALILSLAVTGVHPAGCGLLEAALLVAAVVVAQGALWRVAMPGGQGPALEGRLLAANLLTVLFLTILAALLSFLLLATAYAVASAGLGFDAGRTATWAPAIAGPRRMVAGGVALAGMASWLWAASRVSLAAAATAADRRVRMIDTWTATRGRAWAILAGRLIVAAPALALVVVMLTIAARAPSNLRNGTAAVGTLCVTLLWLPLDTGFVAAAWTRLAPAAP